ncbi:hypothetical protein BJ085DRAFT_33568 [Dimargaris cristalligena]|uniref:Uncharacterized protein n=1 Tax=Dimargaris cristalligena TaxID=215637 RepID=A0A4P9ZPB1_9FUNG|nr:hypothetical protein BJ085DRAFT_33568 [Dimargaris cristalligena]|eukprot:RKP35065.1 hypothetical protein BJ085DRAFT_33568 [Dimargaris cristalligena]
MAPEHWEYIEKCPLVLELPRSFTMPSLRNPAGPTVLIAHAALDPRRPWNNQDPHYAMYSPFYTEEIVGAATTTTTTTVLSSSPNTTTRLTKVFVPHNADWIEKWTNYWTQLNHEEPGASGTTASHNPRQQPVSLLYGHDEDKSFNINPFSIGLDSVCYQGGDLTGKAFPGEMIKQVSCANVARQG